jgi:hypothetical protein
MSKVIQLAPVVNEREEEEYLYALLDNGEIWMMRLDRNNQWGRIELPPGATVNDLGQNDIRRS